MIDYQKITEGMHITMNGQHAWPHVLKELTENGLTDQLRSLFKSYKTELSEMPTRLNADIQLLYAQVIKTLVESINTENENEDLIYMLKHIISNQNNSMLNIHDHVKYCQENFNFRSDSNKNVLLHLFIINFQNKLIRNTLDINSLNEFGYSLRNMAFNKIQKERLFDYVISIMDGHGKKMINLEGNIKKIINLTEIYDNLKLTNVIDVLNTLFYDNNPHSELKKACVLTSDFEHIKNMMFTTHEQYETLLETNLEF